MKKVAAARVSHGLRSACVVLGCAALATLAAGARAETVYSGAGSNPAGIATPVADFRAALGSLNANAPGSFGSGRREINWDGVPDGFSAPNLLPANFFNANSPRGVVFGTPGTGFQVSANAASGVPVQFGNLDPSYPSLFEPFTAQRLFTSIGSNVVDVSFFVPGSAQAATTRGFGVVFSDVDANNVTSLTFFDATSTFLGTFYAPVAGSANDGFSFLGVDFGAANVGRVRITSGNQVLAAGSLQEDLVVMDDFIYGEPIAVAVVPEPETYVLMLAGLGVLGLARSRRRSR